MLNKNNVHLLVKWRFFCQRGEVKITFVEQRHLMDQFPILRMMHGRIWVSNGITRIPERANRTTSHAKKNLYQFYYLCHCPGCKIGHTFDVVETTKKVYPCLRHLGVWGEWRWSSSRSFPWHSMGLVVIYMFRPVYARYSVGSEPVRTLLRGRRALASIWNRTTFFRMSSC